VRCPKSADRKKDRTALIADRRNDSNVILSQLQVAFLRAHNVLVDNPILNNKKCSFAEAQKALQQHYQWIVLNDLLPRIVPETTIQKVRNNPNPLYKPNMGVPFEFSMAAFRFGHGMIRRSYYLNESFNGERLSRLFTMNVLCNAFIPVANQGSATLPRKYIIKWPNFFRGGTDGNLARTIRTQMVDPLFELLDDTEIPTTMEGLPVQDLKRSYLMRIPTGQAIAKLLDVEDPLTTADMERVLPEPQFTILKNSGLLERTPLPFYVLAEAAKQAVIPEPPDNPNKGKLGPVGGRIVAEVIIGLIRTIPDSCLNDENWKPVLPRKKADNFDLSDLLTLAGVFSTP
jgi:heme peroxidase